MRDADERTRVILDRVEAHPEQLANLHGVIRSIGPAGENTYEPVGPVGTETCDREYPRCRDSNFVVATE